MPVARWHGTPRSVSFEEYGSLRDQSRTVRPLAAIAYIPAVVGDDINERAGLAVSCLGLLVFVGSRLGAAGDAKVQLHDLAALGLDPAKVYALEDVLSGVSLGSVKGADLAATGFSVHLGPYASAVVRVK